MKFLLFLCLTVILAAPSFVIKGDDFYKDGKRFQYVGGSFHYFRSDPSRWEDVIMKMKAMGLNGLQTYIAWNLHEPERGVYNWEGMANLPYFLELCKKHDMVVFFRPGPYICAEWDLGGIPYWVLTNRDIKIRTSDPLWKNEVAAWFNVLLTKIKPYMWENNGPIAMVQVENEYGSYYACDLDYIRWLWQFCKGILGDNTIYYTTDGAGEGFLKCGTIPEVYSTVDFGAGGDIVNAFAPMRKYQPTGPLLNSEYYPGWLSHWTEDWPRVGYVNVVKTLKEMLEYNASVNFYMVYGGTNFEFYSGANGNDVNLAFDTTSYDYDAPISENGDATLKYQKIREYLQTFWKNPLPEVPKNVSRKSYGSVEFVKSAQLFSNLDNQGRHIHTNTNPLWFEELGNAYGYVLYKTTISGTEQKQLSIPKVHDRAHVYLNGVLKGILIRKTCEKETIDLGAEEGKLEILVENQGRLNFGNSMTDRKGITEVLINQKIITNWVMTTLPMNSLDGLRYENKILSGPAFHYGTVTISEEPVDTWLDFTQWHKGHVYVNGKNIGRHWEVGPTMSLYVPAPYLKQGLNEIIVFEQENIPADHKMKFTDHLMIN